MAKVIELKGYTAREPGLCNKGVRKLDHLLRKSTPTILAVHNIARLLSRNKLIIFTDKKNFNVQKKHLYLERDSNLGPPEI